MRPTQFLCQFVVRSAKVKATIEREGAEALEELQIYEGVTKYRLVPSSLPSSVAGSRGLTSLGSRANDFWGKK